MRFGQYGGGRDELFRSLYEKYFRRLIGFLIRAFRLSEEDAEELAQDAFIRFYEAMDEYRGEAEWAFLQKIATNVALNRIRSLHTAKRQGTSVNIDDADLRRISAAREEAPDHAERQQSALRRKRLHDAIADLPSGQRQCLQLWLDEFQYEEIAKVLRITMDAVRSRIRDARKALRARLGDDGILPEDNQ